MARKYKINYKITINDNLYLLKGYYATRVTIVSFFHIRNSKYNDFYLVEINY